MSRYYLSALSLDWLTIIKLTLAIGLSYLLEYVMNALYGIESKASEVLWHLYFKGWLYFFWISNYSLHIYWSLSARFTLAHTIH